jgi:hypothetical protein
MFDVDTFLTTLYVMVDDFCQCRTPEKSPGPVASLSESEVITLSIFARWSRFSSERDFYRYAESSLRCAFPTLPDRSQFNRLLRSCTQLIEAFALHLVSLLEAGKRSFTRPWTPRRCPSEIASVGDRAGLQAMPTSVGPTAWVGTRASLCAHRR